MVMENELKYWKQLNIDYMTEESDKEDNHLVVHELLWRSKSKIIIKLN